MMETIETANKREVWIDYIKVFACVLVVLGHFLQSMISANVLETNSFFEWFLRSIYMFHVQLFFICSGYLYQKNNRIDDFSKWKSSVLKKFMALGIPYFTFSFITWLLKTIFSDSVNTQVDGLFQSLFVNPISPYWYLYCLFFLFLITPTMQNETMAVCILFVALILKIAICYGKCDIYALNSIMSYAIWFVFGMCLCVINIKTFFEKRHSRMIGSGLMIIFFGGSVLVFLIQSNDTLGVFLLGVIACMATILLFGTLFTREIKHKGFAFFSKYTLPIFLMHTIFAATLRSILIKIGITNSVIHVILGLAISFIGPIIAADIMARFKWMDFFLYPTKYIKRKGNK